MAQTGVDVVAPARTVADDVEPPRWRWCRPLLLFVVALAALTVVELFHARGLPAYRTLWAEDGPVYFYENQIHLSVFRPHAGYAQVAPRLIGWVAARIALSDVAAWFAIASSMLTALLALAVYWLSDFLVPSRLLRAVLAASFVVPPVLVGESLANAANLQWPLLAATFWALIRPIKGWRDGLACAAIVVLAALSSSVAFVFLPLAVLVIVLRRSWVTSIVPAAFGIACAVQAWLTATAPESATRGTSSVIDLPVMYIVRVGGTGALGERIVAKAWVYLGVWLAIGLALAGVAALVVLFTKNDGEGRLWGAAALGMSVVLLCGTVYYRGTKPLRLLEGSWNGAGSRYIGCALQLLVAGVVILVARARITAQWRRAVVWGVAAQALLVPMTAWRPLNGRSEGPTWQAALSAGRHACAVDSKITAAYVLITPTGWGTSLTCEQLR